MSNTGPAEDTPPPPQEANFLQFLYGLGMQTLIHLGQMSNPITGKPERNLVQAKYSIDLLGVLEAKSEGNRTEDETAYLQQTLAQLRMAYVREVERGEEEDSGANGETAAEGAGEDGETAPETPPEGDAARN